MTATRLRIALVVNPWAGVGGPAGLRGSDGESIRAEALARGSQPRAAARVAAFLARLGEAASRADWITWGGVMGEDVLRAAGISPRVAGVPARAQTSAADTHLAAATLASAGIDLLLFAGGDGTARDVCAAVGTRVSALGIPAGVKMYSGVFAVSPEAAAEIVLRLLRGEAVAIDEAEVRDIDEEAFRHDRVVTHHFGELSVPGTGAGLQHVKCGTPPDEALVRMEIAAGVVERMERGELYLVGTGSTAKSVLEALGLEGSLLGIDAVRDGRVVGRDLDARALCALLAAGGGVRLVAGATGGQGFLFGRGNQQLSAGVLRRIGPERIDIVATPGKLAGLGGRPLLVDTGDAALDRMLAGLRPVWTGYRQRVLCRVVAASGASLAPGPATP